MAIKILGAATDDMAVTRFVDKLRSYEVFDAVTLHSSQYTTDEGRRVFTIGCEYVKCRPQENPI